jgi:Glycosyltransferase family 87
MASPYLNVPDSGIRRLKAGKREAANRVGSLRFAVGGDRLGRVQTREQSRAAFRPDEVCMDFAMDDALGIDHVAAGMAWLSFSIPLILTVFFRFGRVWSLRNFDLIVLSGVSVGVALLRIDPTDSSPGKPVLWTSAGILLVRLLVDNFLVKRPRLESNLNPQALAFLGVAAAAVVTCGILFVPLPWASQQTVEQGQEMLNGEAPLPKKKEDILSGSGPVSAIATAGSLEVSNRVAGQPQTQRDAVAQVAAGILAGAGQIAVLAALIFIGIRHFHDRQLAVAMSVLYLLLPSTALDPNSVNHILSTACILWALALYRAPWASGIFMGLACGSMLYPAFALPVWFAFFGRAHARRFAAALLGVWGVLLVSFAFLSADVQNYLHESLQLISSGVAILVKWESPLAWQITDELYLLPIIVSFALMLMVLTVWPREKRFEHLLAASAAVIVGLQFWYPQQVGESLTAYIPLALLIAFRPRLQLPRPPEPRTLRTDPQHSLDKALPEPALSGAGQSSILR